MRRNPAKIDSHHQTASALNLRSHSIDKLNRPTTGACTFRMPTGTISYWELLQNNRRIQSVESGASGKEFVPCMVGQMRLHAVWPSMLRLRG
jgi:hypothetical protein